MSTLIVSLKSEIARIARKELKDEMLSLRKATTAHRSEIATLKREVKALASIVKASQKRTKADAKEPPAGDGVSKSPGIRFSQERFASLRFKLGVTQAQMATLLGVSYLSVHKWEAGAAKPRVAQLQKIAELSKLGKRAALKQLQALATSD